MKQDDSPSNDHQTSDQSINLLLNRPHPEGYRSELTRRIAEAGHEKQVDEFTSLIFRVGAEWLALPSERIREIAVLNTLHTLPHRHNALLGLANVRGELLICVDLAIFLESSAIDVATKDKNTPHGQLLVVVTDQGPLAFPVDEVHGFHRYQEVELRELPATLAGATNTYTYNILPWQGHSVGCLDAQALFRAINQSLS